MVVSSVLPLFERFNLSTVKSSTMLQLDENATISSTSEELTPIPHWPEEVLLEDIFCYHGSFGKRSNVVVRLTNVRLTCEFISCDKKSRVRKVYLRDVIGCKIKMNTTKDRCNLCLEIYYYPIVQIMCVKRRQRHQLSLTVKRASSWDINEKYALKWRSAILFMASRNSKFQDDMNGKKYSILDGPLPKRHILVVINPASGRQRALKIFQSQVVPMFEESEISWVVVVSARKTFTKTYIESADLSPFDGIVSVSGDGLLYEVVNGLLARPDWREAIKIPLGVIPAGSGNAIFRSMTKVQGEPIMLEPVTSSVMNIICGKKKKAKIVLLQTTDDTTCSLSSLEWGLIADIILEAEVLSCLGEVRYGLSGMMKSLNPKKYRCRLSFLRATEENRAKMALARKTSLVRLDSDPVCNKQQKKNSYQGKHLKCSTSRQTSVFPPVGLEEGNGTSTRHLWKTITSLLPSWAQPVPDDWETVEGDFYMIACSYVSRLSAYLSLAPFAKCDDDTIWLTLLKGDIPRIFIPYILIAMRNGKHVNLPAIDTIPILAFRLEPLISRCDFAVDGDFMKGGALQGEILPFTLNVMSH